MFRPFDAIYSQLIRLPNDVKAHKDKAKVDKQSRIDGHLKEKEQEEIRYSDGFFREVAVEWLVATDQPIGALEHPKFHQMIDVASRAKNGVTIPNRHQTREEIMNSFKKQMNHLRTRLNVSIIPSLSDYTTHVQFRVLLSKA
ncbi:hypothetical protein C0992_000495 [Termitomyces sp. T32_za158]|nr:hypothetical protein C0992_000495 [Termitomyces sp. T32_za158]